MSTANLGAPLRTFPYDPEQRKVTLFAGLGLFGIAFVFPALYVLDPVAVGMLPLLFTPALLLVSCFAIAHFVYTKSISLTLHQGGFVYRNHVVPYGSIRGIRYRLVHVVGGYATFNRGFFAVRLSDGRTIKPSIQLEHMEEVIGGITQHAMPVLVDGMTAALASGQVIHAGAFELHPQGIVCRGKSIPWARVALSSSGSSTHVQLLDVDPDSGDYTKVHEAKIADLENASALEAVAEQLRVEAIHTRR